MRDFLAEMIKSGYTEQTIMTNTHLAEVILSEKNGREYVKFSPRRKNTEYAKSADKISGFVVYIVCRNPINRALSARYHLYKADNRGKPLYIKPPNKKDTFKDVFLFGGVQDC